MAAGLVRLALHHHCELRHHVPEGCVPHGGQHRAATGSCRGLGGERPGLLPGRLRNPGAPQQIPHVPRRQNHCGFPDAGRGADSAAAAAAALHHTSALPGGVSGGQPPAPCLLPPGGGLPGVPSSRGHPLCAGARALLLWRCGEQEAEDILFRTARTARGNRSDRHRLTQTDPMAQSPAGPGASCCDGSTRALPHRHSYDFPGVPGAGEACAAVWLLESL
mmetsp:Transcript_47505/g.112988  ORF Transcript_47505/g.112988 Transcript_47505/m.112988 type:complete len:220 (-) Transcript_47505:261-920(-)